MLVFFQTISLKSPYKTMCKDQTLPGIKAYTIAACHDHCKEKFIVEQCKCQAFYMRGTAILSYISNFT